MLIWKRKGMMVPLLLLVLVTSACQPNGKTPVTQTSHRGHTETPSSDRTTAKTAQPENTASSCVVKAAPRSVTFPPLPASLSVAQIQKTQPVGVNWGIGFLIEQREDYAQTNHAHANHPEWNPGYGWLSRMRLPLFEAPHGKARGWIACGWLVDLSAAQPQMSRLEPSLLQTAYETFSLVVLNEQADGWFQLRYGLPTLGHQGVAWAHRSHLRLGDRPLRIQYWKNIFQPNHFNPTHNRGWLQFRADQAMADQHLRSAPTPTSAVIFPWDGTFLQGDYGIEPVEIQGNWMRVRVSVPQDFCHPPGQPMEFHEGWVQWWTPKQGTRLYYSPRGC